MADRSDTSERTDGAALLSRILYFEQEWERLNRELSLVKHAEGEGGTFALRKLHRDMRTLLSRIMRFAETVREGAAGPVTEAVREYLADVFRSGEGLHREINDLTQSLESEEGKE